MNQLHKAIKQFRESKGWSKAELGRRLGNISGQLIGQYEREGDPKMPGGDFFIRWKKTFGFDLLHPETIVSEPEADNYKESEKPGASDLQMAVRELSEATNRHSKIDIVNARNMERLLNILEKVYGIEKTNAPVMDLPELGGEMVVDIREKSKKNQLKK